MALFHRRQSFPIMIGFKSFGTTRKQYWYFLFSIIISLRFCFFIVWREPASWIMNNDQYNYELDNIETGKRAREYRLKCHLTNRATWVKGPSLDTPTRPFIFIEIKPFLHIFSFTCMVHISHVKLRLCSWSSFGNKKGS